MNPFKRVFVAIDFSPTSDEALRQAHERALATGALLAVCHILPDSSRSNLFFPRLNRIASLNAPIETEKLAEAMMNRVADITGRTGDDVTIICDNGTAYEEILRSAEEWKADLIVIGSHGMTSATGILLGSVSRKIIRYAHATVLIARPAAAGGEVIAATDFSDSATPALAVAIDEATRTKAPLTLVHCIDLEYASPSHGLMPFGGAMPTLSEEDYVSLRDDAKGRLLEVLKGFSGKGEAVVTVGHAASELLGLAGSRNASLLVMGTKGHTGIDRVLLGSVAETVAHDAPCSVMITRAH